VSATNERVATIMELAEQEEQDALVLDPALLSGYDGTETLSRNHPVFQMIKQRSQIVGKASGDAVGPRKESGGTEVSNSGAGAGGDGAKVEEFASSNSSSSSLSSSSASGSSSSGLHQHSSDSTNLKPGSTEASNSGSNNLNASSNTTTMGNDGEELDATTAAPVQEEAYTPFAARKKTEYHYGYVEKLVLKFTSYSQNNEESAFVIGKAGGTIGRDASNTVSVPSDMTLQKECHALIGHKAGSFFLKNQGSTHCAAIRIGTEPGLRDWPLVLGATFSAGNSIFVVKELAGGELIAEVIDGPLKGERRKVGQKGATLGRSPDNTLSIADPELSRRHSRIEYDDKDGKVRKKWRGWDGIVRGTNKGKKKITPICSSTHTHLLLLHLPCQYYLSDVGSTNGTYMQLAGPYAKVFHLSLGYVL
jgi:pSer/pThr/pTyr-binding forkhead associated (FHA) protein